MTSSNLSRSTPLASLSPADAVPRRRFAFRLGKPKHPLLLGLSLVVIGLALLPIAYLVIRGAGAGTAAFEYVFSPRTLEIAVNSLALAVGVAVASLVIGVPFAFLTTRTDLPARRVWLMAGLLGMVIPSYLGAIAFLEAFGPVGALQKLLAPLGVTRLPSVYGYFGAWFVITLYTFPYVVMPVRAASRSIPSPMW